MLILTIKQVAFHSFKKLHEKPNTASASSLVGISVEMLATFKGGCLRCAIHSVSILIRRAAIS